MTERKVLELTGDDRVEFLQGLVTNDISRATGGIVYTALLTPQGKYIADFFVLGEPDRLLIDVAACLAPALSQRLNMYRLRADVQVGETELIVSRGIGDAPDGALADPRGHGMGWRAYGNSDTSDHTDWTALRVAQVVPASGIELTPDSYILEAGFERLNGVDFRKGCFVGQEIVARMKHKTTLRKGLRGVTLAGKGEPGQEITTDDGRPVGTLHSVAGDQGIAYLRFDRATGPMRTATAELRLRPMPGDAG